jgi:hypothetical protein
MCTFAGRMPVVAMTSCPFMIAVLGMGDLRLAFVSVTGRMLEAQGE